jgi:hypothetical protein
MGFVNDRAQEEAGGADLALLPGLAGHEETVQGAGPLKDLGFEHATLAGISIGIVDMIIPEEKAKSSSGAQVDCGGRGAVPQGHHHRRRALQQDHRHLDARDGRDLQRRCTGRWSYNERGRPKDYLNPCS